MTNITKALRVLRDFFSERCAAGLFAESLFGILYLKTGIQAMLDKVYPAFENPIYVFDAGFNLIAANWDQADHSAAGKRLIENKVFSPEEFKIINTKHHYEKRVKKSETPLLVYHEEVGFNQLICAIDTKKDVGHIVICGINRPFKKLDYELLQILKIGIDQQMKQSLKELCIVSSLRWHAAQMQ